MIRLIPTDIYMKEYMIIILLLFTFSLFGITNEEQYITAIDKLRYEFQIKALPETLNNWHEKAKEGNKLYPESAKLAFQLAQSYILINSNYGDAVLVMLPVFQISPENSEVNFYMWQIFNNEINLYNSENSNGWLELFGEDKIADIYDMKIKMTSYFAKNIDINESIVGNMKETIIEQSETLIEVDTQEMTNILAKIIDSIFEQKRKEVYTQVRNELLEEEKLHEQEHDKQHDKQRQNDFNDMLEKGFKDLDLFQILPNDQEKIEKILFLLRVFPQEIKKYENIPNYDNLKKAFPNTPEADILNAAFKIYSKREYAKGLSIIEKIEDNNDVRLLKMKLYCLQRTHGAESEEIALIDTILELEPNNKDLFLRKKIIEANMKFNQHQIEKNKKQ